jgi:PAS domain S-box-containing protein
VGANEGGLSQAAESSVPGGFPDAGFEAAADRVPLLVWATPADATGRVWRNRQWLAFTGRSEGPEDGDGWTADLHPDDVQRCLEVARVAVTSREPFSLEYRLRRADGEYRWVLDNGLPWREPDGRVVGYAGWCVDIHETRSALDAFRQRERQQAMVADFGRFALEVDDEQELLDYAVTVLADGLRVPLTSALQLSDDPEWLDIRTGTGWDPQLLGADRVSTNTTTLAGYALATDAPVVSDDVRIESRFEGGPGLQSHGVVSAMSTIIRMPGRPYGVLGAYSVEPRSFNDDDIVFARSLANLLGASFARREVEAELRRRELEARLAIVAGRMGSWRWDIASGAVTWSDEMEAVYGIEPGSFDGTFTAFLDQVHPDDRDRVMAELEAATASGADFSMEHRVLFPGGEVRWFQGRGSPVRNADGEITSWLGIGIDITESKQTEQELRDYEYETRLAFSAGHMGSWRWSSQANRGYWSPELEDLVGVERGCYDGTWDAFVGPILAEDGPALRDAIVAAAGRGVEFAVGYRIRRPDGVIRWIETRGRELDGGDWIGVSIDVTEHRRTEVALRDSNTRLEDMVGRLDTLLAHAPLGFAFYDRELRYVRLNQPLADINGLSIEAHLGRRVSEVLPDVGPAVEKMLLAVMETGAPISDVEITGQTPAQPGVERHWLASYYPVRGAGETPAEFGAIIVEITERKRQERAARLTGALSELLAAEPDLTGLLERAASIMVPDLADSCGIYLLPRTDVARRFAIAHEDPELESVLADADVKWPLDVKQLIAGSDDLREGKPVLVPHVSAEQRRAYAQSPEHRAVIERLDVQSSIIAPLHVADDVVGALCLDYTSESGRIYQPDDLALVEALADRIVLVLERAYLTGQAERARARLNLLAQVSELLTVGLDTRARLDAVTEVVLPTFADVCVAYLVGPDGLQPAVCRFADHRKNADVGTWADVLQADLDGPSPVATALRTREPVLVSDVPQDRGGPARTLGLLSVIAAPLLSADEPIGVLVFGYTSSDRRYGREDLGLVREIAGRVAPAVEDAMRFERELATAEALQRSLLPDRLPVLQDADLATRYVPGGVGLKVGGDWYDAVPLRDGRVMLVIGDVVGHGVRAAASMGKLRNVLQYSALDGLAPAAVLSRLNQYFCGLVDSDMATLLVAEYDPARQRIRYSSAGHPPPMLRMPDGAVVALEGGRSMPLCASDQAQYHEAEHELPAGSVLVLYTDGLIERRGESLDVGFDRLAASLRDGPAGVEDIADALLHDLLADDAPADDVALLCVGLRCPEAALRLRLPAAARELARTRRVVTDWLTRLGASRDESGEIVVAVNEAAANAIEHAYGLVDEEFVVEADVRDGVVEFVVRDFGRWRTRRSSGDRGRGLDLARSLMDEVDIEPSADGTVVRLRRRLADGGGGQ